MSGAQCAKAHDRDSEQHRRMCEALRPLGSELTQYEYERRVRWATAKSVPPSPGAKFLPPVLASERIFTPFMRWR